MTINVLSHIQSSSKYQKYLESLTDLSQIQTKFVSLASDPIRSRYKVQVRINDIPYIDEDLGMDLLKTELTENYDLYKALKQVISDTGVSDTEIYFGSDSLGHYFSHFIDVSSLKVR